MAIASFYLVMHKVDALLKLISLSLRDMIVFVRSKIRTYFSDRKFDLPPSPVLKRQQNSRFSSADLARSKAKG